MAEVSQYAVYYITETDGLERGYVCNRVEWDGSSDWSPPSGCASVIDNSAKYPIGSIYTEPAT